MSYVKIHLNSEYIYVLQSDYIYNSMHFYYFTFLFGYSTCVDPAPCCAPNVERKC